MSSFRQQDHLGKSTEAFSLWPVARRPGSRSSVLKFSFVARKSFSFISEARAEQESVLEATESCIIMTTNGEEDDEEAERIGETPTPARRQHVRI